MKFPRRYTSAAGEPALFATSSNGRLGSLQLVSLPFGSDWVIKLREEQRNDPVLFSGSVKRVPLLVSSDTLHGPGGSALAFSGSMWCWKALSAYWRRGSNLKLKHNGMARLLSVLEWWVRAISPDPGFLKFKFWFRPFSSLKDRHLLYKGTFYCCLHFSLYCVIEHLVM